MDHERPDLQESATALVRQLAEYTITLKGLEDALLARLAASQGDILEDVALVGAAKGAGGIPGHMLQLLLLCQTLLCWC